MSVVECTITSGNKGFKAMEKNTVEEMLLIPLYARARAARLYPQIPADSEAIRIEKAAGYGFQSKDGLIYRFGILEPAMRHYGILSEIISLEPS